MIINNEEELQKFYDEVHELFGKYKIKFRLILKESPIENYISIECLNFKPERFLYSLLKTVNNKYGVDLRYNTLLACTYNKNLDIKTFNNNYIYNKNKQKALHSEADKGQSPV